MKLRLIITLLLSLALVTAAADPYVPRVDPHEPVPKSGEPIEWRGDQMHPRPVAGAPDEGPWVFHIDDFRWTFLPPDATDQRWKPVFLQARVDTRKVKAIHHLWSPFFPEVVAGHSAMLLELEPGGLTRHGDGGVAVPLPEAGTGVVLSVEARIRRGDAYSFQKGLMGRFELVYSLSTEANYRQRNLDIYREGIHRWRLDLSPEEARWVARAALEQALRDHRGETYWLTRRSCSTEFMDMLIDGLERAETSRAEAVKALRSDLAESREQPLSRAEEAWHGLRSAAASAGGLLNPLRWLGLSRDNVRRTTPLGLFVNPVMSMPAQLPGVLYRRGLLDSPEPDEVLPPQPPAG